MTSSDDLASEYADTMVRSIADIMGRYDGTSHDDECEAHEADCTADDDEFCGCETDDCNCSARATEELDQSYALELVAESGEPFSVLLTYGGPTAWVEWNGRHGTSSATLHVTWSSDPVIRRSSEIRALADYYSEVMEAMTD